MNTVVKEILSRDGKLKVQIFRREHGSFGFSQWRFSDEQGEESWIPHGRFSECMAPDEGTAEQEARARVEWLNAAVEWGMVPRRRTTGPNSRSWDLTGLSVTRIVIDPAQVGFLLSTSTGPQQDEIDLVIENTFTIKDSAGRTHRVNPALAETLAPALGLRLCPARSMEARRDGSLTVHLAEGAELHVAKRDLYESWNTSGRRGLADASMLCSPHEGPPWAE